MTWTVVDPATITKMENEQKLRVKMAKDRKKSLVK